MLPFICPECDYYEVYFIGDIAIYFGYRNTWECPNCGVISTFPIQECLKFTTDLWRN